MQHPVLKPENYFFAKDGTILKSLDELPQALKKMNMDTYNFHVSSDRNDFHNWIRDIFKDKDLAIKISEAKNKEEMSKIITRYLSAPKIVTRKIKHIQKKVVEAGPKLISRKKDLPMTPQANYSLDESSKFMKFGLTEFILGIAIGIIAAYFLLKIL